MKKSLLFSAIFAMLAMVSCNSSIYSKEDPPKTVVVKSDTTYTTILAALDYSQNQYAITLSQRITRTDTAAMFHNYLKEGKVSEEITDTQYFIPVVDTMRDQYNRAMIDHQGKVSYITNWVPIGKDFIVNDFNKIVQTTPLKE